MTATPESALLIRREQSFDLARLDRDRQLQRIRAGAYVRKATWEALSPWKRYHLRVLAVARTWRSPVFCLESAAALQGLPVFGEPTHIHLLSSNGRSWSAGDVIVHGHQDEREVAHTTGAAMTAIADTAVDLARLLPPAFALAVVDAAARVLAARGEVLDLGARGRDQADRRGRRQLDWVHARASPTSESVGEAVSRAVIEWLGYEAPVLQQEFAYEGETDRSDFYWRRLRIVGESDGYGKYDASDPEAMKAHFVREKRREDRLRRHEGGFVRWDWADTLRFEPLDKKLRATGLVPVHPRQSLMLRTLRSNPRSFPPRAKAESPKPMAGS